MSLMRNSLVASGAIFACRLTGMAREIVYTSLFCSGLREPWTPFTRLSVSPTC